MLWTTVTSHLSVQSAISALEWRCYATESSQDIGCIDWSSNAMPDQIKKEGQRQKITQRLILPILVQSTISTLE